MEILGLNHGMHLCSIYKTKEEQFSVIIPYFKEGVKRKEKCIYIVEESDKKEIIQRLSDDVDINYDLCRRWGKILFFTKEEAYLKGGYFDPEKMINLLTEAEAECLMQGYNGMRVTGEMTWILTKLPGTEKLIEYEAKLNYFLHTSNTIAICKYHESRFSPEILLDVIRTHPKVILYGELCDNPYYIEPDKFLDTKIKRPKATYEFLRDKLLERNHNV